jgi:hypothetical protein
MRRAIKRLGAASAGSAEGARVIGELQSAFRLAWNDSRAIGSANCDVATDGFRPIGNPDDAGTRGPAFGQYGAVRSRSPDAEASKEPSANVTTARHRALKQSVAICSP